MPRCRVVRWSFPSCHRVPWGSQVCPRSSGGLQLTTGTNLPSGVRYEIQPLPIATNHRLLCSSNAPHSRNLPWGVSLTSANFSTAPTPGGSGGSPQGTGPAGACALGAPPDPQMVKRIANSVVTRLWTRVRGRYIVISSLGCKDLSGSGGASSPHPLDYLGVSLSFKPNAIAKHA